MQNLIHTFIDPLRDRFAPLNHTSNFRSTGQITPEEFLAAGDFLVYKFPSWSWADAATPAQRVSYFPPGKQYLVTRGVPCKRRVKGEGAAGFLGEGGEDEQVVRDMLSAEGVVGEGDDDGWLKAGGDGRGMSKSAELRMRDVRTVDDDGKVGEAEEEEIPDMEDEEDDEEAIIRDTKGENEGCVQHTDLNRDTKVELTWYLAACAHTPSTLPTRHTTARLASTSAATTPTPIHLYHPWP